MKAFLSGVLLLLAPAWQVLYGQPHSIDRRGFLSDTSLIKATIVTDMGKLLSQKKKGFLLPAIFRTKLPGSEDVNDQILLELRGHFRHDYCYMPPLKLIFNYTKPAALYSLKSLKLVSTCKLTKTYDQYLLKEFIIYKIFNLLTDMSFHVRLLDLDFVDSAGRKRTAHEHAFIIEDIKDLAKRNDCAESQISRLGTEESDRRQMTIVAIFEYMIGNTDWSVPSNHNIKLIVPKRDSSARPFVVPYDFDYSGLVNTDYAIPDESLQTQNVLQRVYRGFPRTMAELNEVLDIFRQQKEKIYSTINDFGLLSPRSKEDLTGYLDGFYDSINKPGDIKFNFIDNARK